MNEYINEKMKNYGVHIYKILALKGLAWAKFEACLYEFVTVFTVTWNQQT